MHVLTYRYLSWGLLLASLLAWCGVGYFAWSISAQEALEMERLSGLQEESIRHSSTLRLHALVRETKDERTALDSAARVDVITMLETIEQVGRDAGIAIKLGQATPSSSSNQQLDLHAVAFVVEGEGTFAKLTQVVALFESLPIPSYVNDVQFEMLPTNANTWRLVARVNFITIADISS